MEYQQYYDAVHGVNRMVEAGDFDGAAGVLDGLIRGDISDLDKSLMCINMAVVCDKMGQFDSALEWYDAGIAFELPYYRFQVAENKASALWHKGRTAESLAIYEQLYGQPYLTEADKDRLWKNMVILRNPRK